MALLKQQRPLVKKYWGLASDQIDLFKNGGSTIGASWPYQVNTLKAAKVPVVGVIPKEGVTGWADTWMLSSKAKHPNCAYKWMQYITQPKPQAQQAIYFGETPVNKKACPIMNQLSKGSCAQYSANAPESFYRLDQVLEDAGRRLRQRAEELHRPPGLDDGLAASQGLAAALVSADAARVTEGSPRGGALRSLSRFSWRHPRVRRRCADRAARRRVPVRLRRRARRTPRPGLLDDRLLHREGRPLVEPRQLPRHRGPARTRRSSCARC